MKHQSVKDRMHEGEGMVRHEMKHHGHHKHHSHHAHHPRSEHHGSMHEHLAHEHSRHAMYRHEVDKPHVPGHGHQEGGMGVSSFKGEAQDISFGQAGRRGVMSDAKKEAAQFKNYHWDSDTGGASGY